MSHIRMPIDWEVFNIPPIQPVQYFSILKKQREFSQLVKEYDTKVFKHGYLHYCDIVPRYLNSSLSKRHEIFILFLDGIHTTSFIGFRIKVSKETFTHESKSLLLFLKNSQKAISYCINRNRIHVNCGTNAWELFYLLYDNYLRKYVLTIIGTRFFNQFVYSYYIEKEKLFLKSLYKGSKVIRVSKASIYYQIHRKRKISITDLVYMTLNMPKRKKYTLSTFNPAETLLNSGVTNGDFYTVAGNKIKISKLMLKKYQKQNIVSKRSSQKIMQTDLTHKRKFDEIDANHISDLNTSSKHFKKSESYSTENQWNQYKKFKFYSLKNYSNIPFIHTLVPSLLRNENSSCSSNFDSMNTHSSINLPFQSDNKKYKLKSFISSHNTYELIDHKKKDECENHKNLIQKTSLHDKKSVPYSDYVIPKIDATHYSDFPDNDKETLTCTNNSNLKITCDINSSIFLSNINAVSQSDFACEDINFATASGKVINISSAAMLKAHTFCEKQEKLREKITSDAVKHEIPEKNKYPILKRMTGTSKISENKYSHTLSVSQNEKNIPKKIATSHLPSLKLDNFDVTEDVNFSTAAGTSINVSNSAMLAAQKFIHKVNKEEKMCSKNEPIQKEDNYKSDDVDMDNTFVEKFFEDVEFDEKELQLTEGNVKRDNLNVFQSKIDKSVPTRKPRKSLGGRRSMKYCSDKM